MSGIEGALTGIVVSDAIELRTSQAGKKWAAFNVAVGEGDGRQYIRASVFGTLAERASAGLAKGTKVYLEGHSLRLSEWTSRSTGETRTGLQMVASKLEKVGTSAIGRNKPPKKSKAPQDEQPATNGQATSAMRDYQRPPAGDEIPFAPEVR
jgi:single-stranded DNA-binding protein